MCCGRRIGDVRQVLVGPDVDACDGIVVSIDDTLEATLINGQDRREVVRIEVWIARIDDRAARIRCISLCGATVVCQRKQLRIDMEDVGASEALGSVRAANQVES